MAVKNELTSSGASGSDTEAVNDVVKARLEELEKDFTGDTFETRSLSEEVAELFFQYAVGVFSFLLFAELDAVFRSFAALVLTMLAGGEVTTLKNLVFAKDGLAELAGYFGLGTCISCNII